MDIERSGYCPVESSLTSVGTCARACDNDGECSGTQKCCINSCGGTQCAGPDVGEHKILHINWTEKQNQTNQQHQNKNKQPN